MYYQHNIDPAIIKTQVYQFLGFSLGPIEIRYYGLMYLTGFILAYLWLQSRNKKLLFVADSLKIQDLITYVMVGMIVGARLIYMLIYDNERSLLYSNIIDFFKLWDGISFFALIFAIPALLLLHLNLQNRINSKWQVNFKDYNFVNFTYWSIPLSFAISRFWYIKQNDAVNFQYLFDLFKVWQGGLSFHGAAIGFIFSMWFFAKKYKYNFWHIADHVAITSAIGIFFGRFGNFTNGELWGRPSDVPWAVIFPAADMQPRHPSQIYQAFCEGLFVYLILLAIDKWQQKKFFQIKDISKHSKEVSWSNCGIVGASFLIFYGIGRFIIEFYREPDRQLGYYLQYFSMGQILCTIMIIAGIILVAIRLKKPSSQSYTVKVK